MSDERERMEQLCKQIQTENDQKKFNDLIAELNDLLAKSKPGSLGPLEESTQG